MPTASSASCVVEYTGRRQPRNKSSGQPPSPQLVQQFANLCSSSLTAQHSNACSGVQIAADAEALLDAFDILSDGHINNAAHGGERQADVEARVGCGAILAGTVTLGERALVNAGATVIPNLRVGADSVVEPGSTVVHEVADGARVEGTPARPL